MVFARIFLNTAYADHALTLSAQQNASNTPLDVVISKPESTDTTVIPSKTANTQTTSTNNLPTNTNLG